MINPSVNQELKEGIIMGENTPVGRTMNGAIGLILILSIAAAAAILLNVYLLMNLRLKPAQVVLYEGPPEQRQAIDYQIQVNNKPLHIYNTAVNFNRTWTKEPRIEKTPMAYFDFDGTVKIDIKSKETKVENVVVRPLSLGIKPEIKGDTISFELDKPAKLTIEVNGNIKRAIHLFANPLEKDVPRKDDPNVIYFGPGIHKVGRIPVKSNQTVYISGGAVVYGCIKAENLENVKISGRGIIDGSIYDRWVDTTVPIDLRNCKNSSVEGIMLLDPAAWTLNIYESQNIDINDVKIISARSNSDGITIQSSNDITVSNCFVRSWDDSLVVKGYGSDTKGVTFDNCIVWTDLAQSCEIGYETRANTIEDITFKNITVLHNFHKPVLSIHNTDNALVRNIHYQNIVVEDASLGMGDSQGYNYLIDLFIGNSQWSQTSERGSIKGVYFDNIEILGGNFQPSRIYGYDDKHTIENVNIKGLKILGEEIKDTESGEFKINNYANTIKFQ
jgi:hypothetical protein